jgi:DNA modification methylase
LVILGFKNTWKRTPPEDQRHYTDDDDKEEGSPAAAWTDLTRNVWKIRPARRKDHPAPFPPELAARAIRLSTWPGETVLDPFAGSGTTLDVAEQLGRVGIGYDIDAPRPKETK